jgi:hypothetical protein
MQTKLDINLAVGKVPAFEEIVPDLEDLPAVLYECIEAGTIRGRAVADEERFGEDPLDPWLVSTVLRGRVRKMLKRRGVDSTIDGPFNLSSQPLVGLLFHFKMYSFRILKAVQGCAPGCGQSRPRHRFYDQVPTKYRSQDGKLCTSKLNLLLLYPPDAAAHLILACPSMGARFAHEVDYHWIEKLPHPGEDIRGTPPTPPPSDSLADIVQRRQAPFKQNKKS